MIPQNEKINRLIDPAAIVDNGSFTSQVVDTLGWDWATAFFHLGATDIAMAALVLQESDDNSSYADISATNMANTSNLDIAGTAVALPSSTDDNKFVRMDLDLRHRKRYLKAVATAGDGSTGTYLEGCILLRRGEVFPSTVAGAGCDTWIVT